jgi:hypothetical protein
MKRFAFVLILAGGAVALAASHFAADGSHVAPQPLATNHSHTTSPAGDSSAKIATPVSSAGFVVHFDQSGKIVEEATSPVDFNAGLQHSVNTSSEGLVEEAAPVGGGVMVNLQGRFQSAMTATVDANGNVVVPCLSNEHEVDAFTSTTAVSAPATKE